MRIGIIITTNDNYAAINQWLSVNSKILMEYAVDIRIYNYGQTNNTNAIVTNYNVDGFSNIVLITTSTNNDDPFCDYYSFIDSRDNYDYVWICDESFIVTETAIKSAIKAIKHNYKLILLYQSAKSSAKRYETLKECYIDNYPNYQKGSAIVNTKYLADSGHNLNSLKEYGSLWPSFFFINPYSESSVLVNKGLLFDYNPFSGNGDRANSIEFWFNDYYKAMVSLKFLDEKTIINHIHYNVQQKQLFNINNLIILRCENKLNRRVIKKNINTLSQVSTVPLRYFKIIAMTPRIFIKKLNNRRGSLVIRLLRALYYVFEGKVPNEEMYQ